MISRRDCLKDSGQVSAAIISKSSHFGLMAVSWA